MEKEKNIEIIMDAAGAATDNTVRIVVDLGNGVRYCTENGKRIEPCPTEEETRNYEKVTLNLDSGGNHEQHD